MNGSIVVRRATIADAAAFARLMGDPEVYAGTLQMPFTDAEVWRARLAERLKPDAQDLLLVAELDGDVAGNAGLDYNVRALRRTHARHLGIAVDPRAHGRGVGSALMAALLDYADNWAHVLRLELTVFTDNAPAIALYRKFGFEIEGTHRAYALRGGEYVDAYAMARLHPKPPQLPQLPQRPYDG